MKLQTLIFTSLLAAGCASHAVTARENTKSENKKESRPNILFILTDDHASQSISAYGSNRNKTPGIDRIAKEGMLFNNVFCTNSICTPSRACILTGKYSHLNGVRTWEKFDGTQTTLQGEMQKAGYHTMLCGKWHLGSIPTAFDNWMIFSGNGQGRYEDPLFRVRRDDVQNSLDLGKKNFTNNDFTREIEIKGYATDIVTDEAFKMLDARPKDKPFMMLLWHKAPHRTWDPPKRFEEWLKDEMVPEPATLYATDYATRWPAFDAEMRMTHLGWGYDLKLQGKQIPKFKDKKEEISFRYQQYIKRYLRVVRALDENVGRTLDYLDKNKLTDNTIVIYSSDQGFFLGENSWFDKRWMYDTSCKMPFIVRYPKAVKAGQVNNDLIMNIDFAPTLLDMAGIKKPDCMQGESIKPILLTNKTPKDWRKATYYRYYDGAEHHVAPHYGCRTKDYKLMYFPKTPKYPMPEGYIELFDLKKDPMEQNNVAFDPQYAQILSEMKKTLADLRTQYKDND